MTCKDCIHYDVCQYHITEETDMTVAECGNFKNKAEFVEVVRCKGCKYYVAEYCTRDIKGRTNMFYMQPDDFCSYGERRAEE
jgi:hypothetical protein